MAYCFTTVPSLILYIIIGKHRTILFGFFLAETDRDSNTC